MTNTDLNASSVAENKAVSPAQTTQPQDPYAELSLPENSLMSADDLAAFKQTAADIKLPAAGLQQWLVHEENRLQAARQQAAQAKQAQLEAWARQTQDVFGPAWQDEVSKAVRAADAFGGAPLRQLLAETGLGNHPVIVRTFHGVAQRICEDVTPGGASQAPADKTFTQALYGKNQRRCVWQLLQKKITT